MEYLVLFFLTSYILYVTRKGNQTVGVCIAVFLASVLAGVRSPEIGSDTAGYPYELFALCKQSRNLDVLLIDSSYFLDIKELGYVLLAFITAKFTDSFNAFLFVNGLIVYGSMAYFLSYCKKKYCIQIWLPWFMFCFVMYNTTMALGKQPLAIAFCLLAYIYYEKGRRIKSVAAILIAFSFHFTSIICLLYVLAKKYNNRLSRLSILVFFLLLVLGSNLELLSSLFSQIPILGRFSRYTVGDDGDIAMFELLYKLFIFCGCYFLYRKKQLLVSNKEYESMCFFMLLEMVLESMSAVSAQAGRLGYYFLPLCFIYISYFLEKSKKKICYQRFFCLSLIAYWVIVIVIQGSTHSYPYKFV